MHWCFTQQRNKDQNYSYNIRFLKMSNLNSTKPVLHCSARYPYFVSTQTACAILSCNDFLFNDLSSLFSKAMLRNPITVPTPCFCKPRALNHRLCLFLPLPHTSQQATRFSVKRGLDFLLHCLNFLSKKSWP